MQLLAYPWRLQGGAVVTVTQDADSGDVDAIARIALTRHGDLPLVPTYGVPEAAFDELSVAAINATLALHGPQGVRVSGEVVSQTERAERVTLSIVRETT